MMMYKRNIDTTVHKCPSKRTVVRPSTENVRKREDAEMAIPCEETIAGDVILSKSGASCTVKRWVMKQLVEFNHPSSSYLPYLSFAVWKEMFF